MSPDAVRILCVDDEPNLLSALRRVLRADFDVEIAANAEDALHLLEQSGPFAAVVSDLRMPGTNGMELLARVRARWPGTARILFSGNTDVAGIGDALASGTVSRCLAKPLAPPLLRAAVADAVAALKIGSGEPI